MTSSNLVRTQHAFVTSGIVLGVVLACASLFVGRADAAMLTQQLDLGDSNSSVTSLQTYLSANSSYYPEGIISGYFGSLTAAAVSRFQSANGLSVVGRVGPQTLTLINSLMGGGSTGGGNTGDVSAPVILPETVSAGTNAVTISWATSEAAKSRVMYGTTWPFLYATAPSVSTNSYNATASITITGLQSNTTYYYVRESIDGSGNVQWTTAKGVKTL